MFVSRSCAFSFAIFDSEASAGAPFPERRPDVAGAGSTDVYNLAKRHQFSLGSKEIVNVYDALVSLLRLCTMFLAFLRMRPLYPINRNVTRFSYYAFRVIHILLEDWNGR